MRTSSALVAQDQAAGDNIALVDLNTNFPSNGLYGDGLHPNDTGYAWMASQWASAILASADDVDGDRGDSGQLAHHRGGGGHLRPGRQCGVDRPA